MDNFKHAKGLKSQAVDMKGGKLSRKSDRSEEEVGRKKKPKPKPTSPWYPWW